MRFPMTPDEHRTLFLTPKGGSKSATQNFTYQGRSHQSFFSEN